MEIIDVNIPSKTRGPIGTESESRAAHDRLQEIARYLAHEWALEQARDPFEEYFLFYRRSEVGVSGRVTVATDAPEDFELADGRRIMPTFPESFVQGFIFGVLYRLPILTQDARKEANEDVE